MRPLESCKLPVDSFSSASIFPKIACCSVLARANTECGDSFLLALGLFPVGKDVSGMKVRANREFQPGGVVQVGVKNTFFMGTIRHCQRVDGGFDTGLKLTESFRSSLL